MSGSYILVDMGALNEIILRQPLPGGVLGSWSEGDLPFWGGCRNIPSHPVEQENLKNEEFVPRGGGSKFSESLMGLGTLGLCGLLTQGSECSVLPNPSLASSLFWGAKL